jgi:hypothetical protein
LIFSIYDSTEVAIQKMMIEASQRMSIMNSQGGELGGISPPLERRLELETKHLQNAPRDPDKLERLLKANRRKKQEAMHIEDRKVGYRDRNAKCLNSCRTVRP